MKGARSVLVILLLLAGASTVASSQEMTVPVDVQYPLLMKVFATTRGFAGRVGQELVIGIVYQPKFRRSVDARDALVEAIGQVSTTPLESIPIRVVDCPLGDAAADPATVFGDTAIDLIYIAPLRAVDVKMLTTFAGERPVMTCTGVPAYVDDGVTVGVDSKGNRPQILINLAAAKTERIEFPHQLLQLASVTLLNLSSIMRK